MSKLYVTPTPVGNLADITFWALRILKEVAFIIADDPRKSSFLPNHLAI